MKKGAFDGITEWTEAAGCVERAVRGGIVTRTNGAAIPSGSDRLAGRVPVVSPRDARAQPTGYGGGMPFASGCGGML